MFERFGHGGNANQRKAIFGEPAPNLFGERIFGRVLRYKRVLLDRYEVRMNILPGGAIYLVLNPTAWVSSLEANLVGRTYFSCFTWKMVRVAVSAQRNVMYN